MPTHNGAKVRVLLKQKRAKVVSKCPFTIKLLYESTSFTQPLTLGVDTGSKYVGSAVINDTTSEIIYEAQTELRGDIKSKMDRRRQFRRARRNKLRYRPARFNNRKSSKRENRYSPTLMSKFQGHVREIKFVMSILPIKDVVLEVGEFDPQLLQDPTLAFHKLDYQRGELYQQENFNEYKKKCVPKGNYPRTGVHGCKFVILPKGKITGFKRYDKVLYNNKEYFIAGRVSIGYIYLIDIDNNRVQTKITKRSTGEKHMSKAKIKVSLVKKVASAKSCVCTRIFQIERTTHIV